MHVGLESIQSTGATSAQNFGNTYLGVADAKGEAKVSAQRDNIEEIKGQKCFLSNASKLSDQTKDVSLNCMGLEEYSKSDDRGGAMPMC